MRSCPQNYVVAVRVETKGELPLVGRFISKSPDRVLPHLAIEWHAQKKKKIVGRYKDFLMAYKKNQCFNKGSDKSNRPLVSPPGKAFACH